MALDLQVGTQISLQNGDPLNLQSESGGSVTVVQASETDTAGAVIVSGPPVIGSIVQATETNVAQIITPVVVNVVVNLAQVFETDTAQTITPDKIQTLPLLTPPAEEINTALTIGAIVNYPPLGGDGTQYIELGQAEETDSAGNIDTIYGNVYLPIIRDTEYVWDIRPFIVSREYECKIRFEEHLDPIKKRGKIILNKPLDPQYTLLVKRKTPIVDEFVPEPHQPFNVENLEYNLDKICYIQQEIEGTLCACPPYPPYEGQPVTPPIEPPPVEPPEPPPPLQPGCDYILEYYKGTPGWQFSWRTAVLPFEEGPTGGKKYKAPSKGQYWLRSARYLTETWRGPQSAANYEGYCQVTYGLSYDQLTLCDVGVVNNDDEGVFTGEFNPYNTQVPEFVVGGMNELGSPVSFFAHISHHNITTDPNEAFDFQNQFRWYVEFRGFSSIGQPPKDAIVWGTNQLRVLVIYEPSGGGFTYQRVKGFTVYVSDCATNPNDPYSRAKFTYQETVLLDTWLPIRDEVTNARQNFGWGVSHDPSARRVTVSMNGQTYNVDYPPLIEPRPLDALGQDPQYEYDVAPDGWIHPNYLFWDIPGVFGLGGSPDKVLLSMGLRSSYVSSFSGEFEALENSFEEA